MLIDEDARERYSVMAGETNPLQDTDLFKKVDKTEGTVALTDQRLARIERLRLVGYDPIDFPEWEIVYCIGALTDGRLVNVDLGGTFLRPQYKAHLVELFQAAGRHGKAMGLFEAISILPG